MKKLLLKLTTLLLAVVIGMAGFSGCNLITDDTERNINQVVATVNINKQENIYKKDLIVGYMNYGYIYTQYYGYDAARTYKLILNGLIENRIVVQVATDVFENGDAELGIERTVNEAYAAPALERYLTADEITEAKYYSYKSINDLLDSYSEDKSKTEIADTLIFDVRTVPTDAKNAEKDVDKEEYVEKIENEGFDVSSDEYKRGAFNKVIKLLKANDLLGKDYDGTLLTTEYLKQLLKNNYESQLISNYEEAILKSIKDSLTYEKLAQSYTDKLNEQKEWSNQEFVDALSSASATSPILYSNQEGKYGYVYNLLLGINDYQSKQIEELQEERVHEVWTEEKYSEERAKVLAGTIAQDLRKTWILSGYDFDFATKKFTGDYTFAKDAANSLPFQGTVREVRPKTDDEDGVYAVESVRTFGLEEFTKFVNNYVYGDETVGSVGASDDIYWEYTTDALPKDKEYDAKINELLFAFSTDPGSLNTYKGYVIKPDNNEYVKTFGDAGKALLEEGGSSYKVVASDYGYHFMFFSEVWTANKEYATLDDYLATLDIDMQGQESWEKYIEYQREHWEDFEEENNFLYFLANELISAKLSATSSKSRTVLVNKYRYDTKYTNVYESRYADLIG